jgi:hypothetical protein
VFAGGREACPKGAKPPVNTPRTSMFLALGESMSGFSYFVKILSRRPVQVEANICVCYNLQEDCDINSQYDVLIGKQGEWAACTTVYAQPVSYKIISNL